MGCGGSVASGTSKPLEGAILVHSAKGLRNDTDLLTGCDPYVLCRLGPSTADWAAKPSKTERRSETVKQNPNPVWRLAFTFALPGDASLATWELHMRVYDKDCFTFDDFLGELRVGLADLMGHANEARDYPLALAGVTGATVSVMAGSKVEKAIEEELQGAMGLRRLNAWQAPVIKAVNKLGQFFGSAIATPYYWANMVQMAFVWSRPVGDSTDQFVEWFRARTTDSSTGEDTYRWSGPEVQNSTTFNGNSDCARRLAELGPRLGTNNGDGKSSKPNFLGFQALNGLFWPEVPWQGIGLSMPQEAHAWVRPLLVRLSGPGGRWSSQWVEEEAAKFFLGRETIAIDADIRAWGSRVLHQVFLGLELTEQEAHEFMTWQKKILVLIGSPQAALETPGLREIFDVDGCLEFKRSRMEKYKPLLKQVLPAETAGMDDAKLTILTSVVLDALLFAGGQSVPSVICQALALPYSAWGAKNLPADFSLHDMSKLPAYVWEVIRRFPPVSGFVYDDRSFGSSPDERIFLNLHLGQQDPRVWNGADAFNFVLRPLAEYHTKSVGFAEPSLAPRLESPNAHSCPAKDLAFGMALAFVREFARSAANVEGGHKAYWVARSLELKDDAHPPLTPEDIELSLYGVTSFLLAKDTAAAGPVETDTSGAWILERLSEEDRAKLKEHVHKHNKMDEVNFSTRLWVRIVEGSVQPGSEYSSKSVGPPKQLDISESDVSMAPFGGIKFLRSDEDDLWTRLQLLGKMIVLAGAAAGSISDGEDKLLWFDTKEEAVASMDATFGPYLPPQFSTWEDMATDEGMRALCLFGVGSWYLTPARSSEESGHDVPAGAAYEVNLEYLAKYASRAPWITNGHTLYLAAPEEGGVLPGPLLGIWSCHHGQLFAPGANLWEHAKAGFRCSLVISVTLKDHLLHSHWIYGNGLMLAARRKLSADHPVRRFLKQFYYGTATVNRDSEDALLPVGHFGHRTFPFTDESWVALFTDLVAAWEWVPIPEKLKRSRLPAPLLEALPLAADGELLWRTIEQHVTAYLAVFYATEDAVLADQELPAFWADFETQLTTPWRLPQLARGSLTCLLTDLIWWVTAGHEFVGAIVEYLSTPLGMASKLTEGATVPDVQTWTQDLVLIALTGERMPPLMDDWTHMFKVDSWAADKQQAAVDLARKFQADLATVSDEIANRNIQRERRGERKCAAFDPRTLETSVSI